jgi:hypothetical protein
MMNQTETAQLEKAWMATRIVWSALLGSLGVYLIVAKVLEENLTPFENIPFELLKNILFGVAILVFIAAFFVRKALMGTADESAPLAPRSMPSPVAQATASQKYIVGIVATSALCESIGVSGLVFFILSRDTAALYQFVAVSALAMFIYRPRKEEFMKVATGTRRNG